MSYIGIDIGATYIRVARVSEDGKVERVVKFRHPEGGDEMTIARLLIRHIREIAEKGIRGIGIGSIGPLDLWRGMVVNTPNAPIKTFKLVEPLIREFKVPVVLGNDAMAAVWGEYCFGIGRGVENLVYITFSTGIGAGVIVDGNLLVGKDGNAHEVGHIVLSFNAGFRCGCGSKGHWEAYGGGANISRALREYVRLKGETYERSYIYRRIIEGQDITCEEVFKAYYDGDELAVEFIDEFLMRIHAAGIATIISVYDPELIIIGGSVALNNKEVFLRGLNKYLGEYIYNRPPRVEFTTFGDDIGVIGAAALVINTPLSLRKYVDHYLRTYL